MSNSVESSKSFKNLFQKSALIDEEIIVRLGHLLIGKSIVDEEQMRVLTQRKVNSQDLQSIVNELALTYSPGNCDNCNKLKASVEIISTLFQRVDDERSILKKLLLELLKSRAWESSSHLVKEKYFVDRFSGLNFELMSKRIVQLEDEIEKSKEKQIVAEKNAKELEEERRVMAQQLENCQFELKKLIMNDHYDQDRNDETMMMTMNNDNDSNDNDDGYIITEKIRKNEIRRSSTLSEMMRESNHVSMNDFSKPLKSQKVIAGRVVNGKIVGTTKNIKTRT